MNTSEVLDKAADLIQERGWTAGPSGWPKSGAGDSLCLEGGIMAALGVTFIDAKLGGFWACPAYRAVQSYLGLPVDLYADLHGTMVPEAPLWEWNDDHTAAEVVEVLRAAAMVERTREAANQRVEVSA